MNSAFRQVFAFLLATSILVSSSGVVLAVHTCLSSSTKQISLFEHKGCCAKTKSVCHKAPKTGIKTKCCELTISYHKIEVNASVLKYSIPLQVDFFSLPEFSVPEFPVTAFQTSSLNKAPPDVRGGTALLFSLHRLLI